MNPDTRTNTPSRRTPQTTARAMRRSIPRTLSRAASILLTAGLVLSLSPAAMAASQTSDKTVCVTYEVLDDTPVLMLSCVTAWLDTWTDCGGTGTDYQCTVFGQITLDVHKPNSCGRAWSEATPGEEVEACSSTEDTSAVTPVVVAGVYPVPPEGRTVDYESTVCVEPDDTLPSTGRDPVCKAWTIHVLLEGRGDTSLDPSALLGSVLTKAEWADDTANETATNPPVSIE